MHKISCVKNVQSNFIYNNQDWKNWNVHYQVKSKETWYIQAKEYHRTTKKEGVPDILNSMDKI